MADPTLNLSVIADITALQNAMNQATQSVNAASQQMTQAAQSFAARWDAAMSNAGRSAKRINTGMDFARSATLIATGDIEGGLNALPGVFGAVAGAAFSLGGALHEAFTGAKAALAEAAAEAQKMETRSGFKAATRDAERMLEIEEEADPIRKLELERQNAIAVARRQARQSASEGAGHEAAAAAAAQERVINAQYDNKIREKTTQLAKEQSDAEQKLAAEAMKKAEEAQKEAEAKAKAMERGQRLIEDANAESQIASAADDATKRRLALERDLHAIERERIDNAKEMGEHLASQVAEAQAGMRIAKEQAELQDELKQKQEELADMQKAASGAATVQSVDFGFGGSMAVATQGAQQGVLAANEKQVALQQQITALVAAIARNTSTIPTSGLQ